MRRHAGTTPRTRRRARTPGAQALQALRRYDHIHSFAAQDSHQNITPNLSNTRCLTYLLTTITRYLLYFENYQGITFDYY